MNVRYCIRQSEIDCHRDVVGDYAEQTFFIYGTLRTTWGGSNNCITAGAAATTQCYNFIGGGCDNVTVNTDSSIILGGRHHCIYSDCSAVFGGFCNTVNAPHSTIIGGSYNTVLAAHSYASVFGNTLTSASADTFHVSCLNAINTPGPGGWPLGTIFFVPVGGFPPPGARGVLWVM